jgi:hypothetical protein
MIDSLKGLVQGLYVWATPKPKIEDYPDYGSWAKAHIDWKCQKEGWKLSTFNQFCDKVEEEVFND